MTLLFFTQTKVDDKRNKGMRKKEDGSMRKGVCEKEQLVGLT